MTQSSNAQALDRNSFSPQGLALAAAAWLLVLPAAIFLAAAALRELQPRMYEPARTSWLIFEWATAHVSHLGAAVLFLLLPGVALAAGLGAVWHRWKTSAALREDAAALLAVLRRQMQTFLLVGATLLGAAILTFAVHQLIVG